MKKLALIAIGSFALFSCQQEKTAFVDNEKLIEEYQERKDIEEKYKIRIEKYSNKKDSIESNLKVEFQNIQSQEATISKEKRQELYQVFMRNKQILEQQLQQEQQIIGAESQKEIDSLLSKIDNAILEYGKANGYAYIFGKNKVGSVLYGAENKDITQTVLEELNKQYNSDK